MLTKDPSENHSRFGSAEVTGSFGDFESTQLQEFPNIPAILIGFGDQTIKWLIGERDALDPESWPYVSAPPIPGWRDWGLQMKNRSEAETTEGFTLKTLLAMAVPLAEARDALAEFIAHYDVLAKANGLPASYPPIG